MLPFARVFAKIARSITGPKVERKLLFVNFSSTLDSAINAFKIGLGSDVDIMTFAPCVLRENQAFMASIDDDEFKMVSVEREWGTQRKKTKSHQTFPLEASSRAWWKCHEQDSAD